MKDCDNCDHKEFCPGYEVTRAEPCKFWDGWISAEEELPSNEDSLFIVLHDDGEYEICEFSLSCKCFGRTVTEKHYELESCPIESWFEGFDDDESIVAWRELPKFEGSKDGKL